MDNHPLLQGFEDPNPSLGNTEDTDPFGLGDNEPDESNAEQTEPAPQTTTPETLYGLTWPVLRDISMSPKVLQVPALALACHLSEQDKMRATVEAAALKIKKDSFAIEEIVTWNPRLFVLERGGKVVRMTASGTDPALETPTQAKERQKREEKERQKARKNLAVQEEEERDTPYNKTWKDLIQLSMTKKDAQGLAKRLVSIYPQNMIDAGINMAKEKKPEAPAGYILSTIKNMIADRPAGNHGGTPSFKPRKPRIVFARQPRTGRTTTLIGWEASLRNGIRHKLFRVPEGTIIREKPRDGEHVPTFDEDPGYEVS